MDIIQENKVPSAMIAVGVLVSMTGFLAVPGGILIFLGIITIVIRKFFMTTLCKLVPNVVPFKGFHEKNCGPEESGTGRNEVDTCSIDPETGEQDSNRIGHFSIKGQTGCFMCPPGYQVDADKARRGAEEPCVKGPFVQPTSINDRTDDCPEGHQRGLVGQVQGRCWKCPDGSKKRPLKRIPPNAGVKGCVKEGSNWATVGSPGILGFCNHLRGKYPLVVKRDGKCQVLRPFANNVAGIKSVEMCNRSNRNLFNEDDPVTKQETKDGGKVFPGRTGNKCLYCPPGFEPNEDAVSRRGNNGCKSITPGDEKVFIGAVPAEVIADEVAVAPEPEVTEAFGTLYANPFEQQSFF